MYVSRPRRRFYNPQREREQLEIAKRFVQLCHLVDGRPFSYNGRADELLLSACMANYEQKVALLDAWIEYFS
jgi:hypothetical protein